tara:strand:+ start:126 stop:719 length:594 start_codon:yes stop_codon:yes gene_type:complete
MFKYKSNSIFSFIILIFFLNTSDILALTKDIELNIGSGSTLNIEYVLAKGICRMLSREQDVSKFMGGLNSLKCDVSITNGSLQNLDDIRSKKLNYAIINLSEIPLEYDLNSLSSVIFFKGKSTDWILITSSDTEKQETCEITEAIFKNSLELKYLHSEFKDFSYETFTKKKLPIHMGSFKYFENKECRFINKEVGEL